MSSAAVGGVILPVHPKRVHQFHRRMLRRRWPPRSDHFGQSQRWYRHPAYDRIARPLLSVELGEYNRSQRKALVLHEPPLRLALFPYLFLLESEQGSSWTISFEPPSQRLPLRMRP